MLITILQVITLSISAWGLLKVIDLGERVLSIETALRIANILR